MDPSEPARRKAMERGPILFLLVVGWALAAWGSVGTAGAATLEEVQACVSGNSPKKTLRQSQTLLVFDRGGRERKLEMDLEWKRFGENRSKSVLRVTSPPDMRGSAVLVIEKEGQATDIFSYLPELGKTRRLNSRSLSSSAFGSDFSYQDLDYMQNLLGGSDQKLLSDSEVNGRPVYVVESRTQGEAAGAYERVVTFIDADRCVLVRAEMRGDGARILKTMAADPGKVVARGGGWEVTEVRVEDPVRETHSVIRIEDSETDVEIKDAVFTRGALERRGR